MSMDETWSRLCHAGLVSGTMPMSDQNENPWPLRVLQGAGGWLGALFLLGAITVPVLSANHNSGGVIFGFGLALAAVAIPILRSESGLILSQFGLAISLAAQGAIAGGLGIMCNDWGPVPAIGCALCSTVLLLTTPQPIHRWWCAAIGSGVLLSLAAQHGLIYLTTGPIAVIVALLLLTTPLMVRYQAFMRPIGWGLGSAWALWIAIRMADLRHNEWSFAASGMEVVAVLIVTALVLQQTWVSWSRAWPALIAALIPASLGLVIPGASIALTLLLVAVAERERLLLAVGVVGLLLLIGAHYQLDHHMPLINKAVGLGAIGFAALVLRIAVNYYGRKLHA